MAGLIDYGIGSEKNRPPGTLRGDPGNTNKGSEGNGVTIRTEKRYQSTPTPGWSLLRSPFLNAPARGLRDCFIAYEVVVATS